ncbi:MAG: hypothetical protein RR326_13245 [Stenotrophomonas sp.]
MQVPLRFENYVYIQFIGNADSVSRFSAAVFGVMRASSGMHAARAWRHPCWLTGVVVAVRVGGAAAVLELHIASKKKRAWKSQARWRKRQQNQ